MLKFHIFISNASLTILLSSQGTEWRKDQISVVFFDIWDVTIFIACVLISGHRVKPWQIFPTYLASHQHLLIKCDMVLLKIKFA